MQLSFNPFPGRVGGEELGEGGEEGEEQAILTGVPSSAVQIHVAGLGCCCLLFKRVCSIFSLQH